MQKEMFDPPRQRARLVEEGPRKEAKEMERSVIGVFPGHVIDGVYSELAHTQWFSPDEQLPWVCGFYEVMADGHKTKAWYDSKTKTFYASSGQTYASGGFVWRGLIQSAGCARRSLL